MDQRPDQARPTPPSGADPFAGVEAKTVTEIEREERVHVEHLALPQAAQLTQLPLVWLALAIVVCVGATLVGQFVEARHLKAVASELGLARPDEPRAVPTDEVTRDRRALQKRIRELKERRREFDDMIRAGPGEAQKAPEDVPLTVEGLREEVRQRAGDQFETYRSVGTLLALTVGGFGLVLMAVFVRVLWAALFGGAAFGGTMLLGLDQWIVWTVALLAGAFGAWLGPRLLIAAVVTNTTIAGFVAGGILAGGGMFLGTGSEMYALAACAAGAVLGGVLGLRFARPLFLAAVVANTAGVAALALWLMWGDLFPYFWPTTMGGLMLFDGIATRVYHRLRWGEDA